MKIIQANYLRCIDLCLDIISDCKSKGSHSLETSAAKTAATMKTCLLHQIFLSCSIVSVLLIASGKVDGKAVARRHSTRNDTDSSCNQEISNIITTFNTVKRDLEQLKRSTDTNIKS